MSDDDAPPPGYEDDAPPGYTDSDARDIPDLSLKTPGLREEADAPVEVAASDSAPAEHAASLYESDLKFEDLSLSKELLDGLYDEMKFDKPSRIQAKTLPLVLKPPYTHLIAQGHNGCGKTTCFSLAMLSRVDPGENRPQALCMCPTRELVVQNLQVLRKMGKHTGITSIGTNEMESGRRMAPVTQQVVIGTAGRLADAISKRKLALDKLRVLVFDEADEMMKLDGFKDQSVRMITDVRRASPDIQLLLFSATYEEDIKRYCMKIIPGANRVFVDKEDLSLDVIRQYRVDVQGEQQKSQVLKDYIFRNAERLGQTIVFVATRRSAAALHQAMLDEGYKCLKLTGDMEHEARDSAVQQFRNVETKILIATDVISRGFDVSTVTLVINYDLPVDKSGSSPAYDTYLHRIGRSGRFGRKGAAFNFCDMSRVNRGTSDDEVMNSISRYFNREIPVVPAHDEDAFIKILEEAGLAEKTD